MVCNACKVVLIQLLHKAVYHVCLHDGIGPVHQRRVLDVTRKAPRMQFTALKGAKGGCNIIVLIKVKHVSQLWVGSHIGDCHGDVL